MAWQYKQIYPLSALSQRVRWFISNDYYFVLGKGSPWNNPDTPPDIPPDIREVPDPLVYIRPLYVLPAIKSPCGNKVLCDSQGGQETWQVFYEPLRSELMPTHVYVCVEVKDEYYLTEAFRCTALLSHVLLVDNAPNAITYTPPFVKDQGVIEWVSFHSPVTKVPGRKSRLIEFMLEP